MSMNCPKCRIDMQATTIGWKCPICGILVDMHGRTHLPKDEPAAAKCPYFVSYAGQTGYSGYVYGNAVYTSEAKIGHIQQIRQIEADIRNAEGYDRVVVLNVMPLNED